MCTDMRLSVLNKKATPNIMAWLKLFCSDVVYSVTKLLRSSALKFITYA